jgi:hypothetical protein
MTLREKTALRVRAADQNLAKEKAKMDNVVINGIEYAPVKKATGCRAVIVVDRGWIFAGDISRANGRIRISDAVWVFKWSEVGFAAVVADPKKAKADIRKIDDIDMPEGAEVFCVPVADGWGK